MPSHKKKPSSFQKQKLAKILHKKEFLRKLKYMINTISGEDIYSDIPQIIIETIYNERPHSFKVIVKNGCKIPSEIMSDIRLMLPEWTKKVKLIIIPDRLDITLEEFYTVGFTIWLLYEALTDESISYVSRFKKGVQNYIDNFKSIYNKANNYVYRSLKTMGIINSDIGKNLYWADHNMVKTPEPRRGIDNIITLYSCKSESISVEFNGSSRPAKRLGFAFPSDGLVLIDIKPSVLNINGPFAEIPLNVYIQSHALQRLSERIDCFLTGLLHYNMYLSLKDPVVFYDNNNEILIEYRFFDTRAGYFRISIIEGMVIIRTFLFITNNGTPEGQKLSKLTGLQKLDKNYLGIDKLSTFMDSDIKENKEVQRIFEKAGCRCLIELYERMQPLVVKHTNQLDTNLMLNYMATSNDNLSDSLPDTSLLKSLS